MSTISDVYERFKRLDLRGQVPIIVEMTGEQMILLNQSQLYTQSLDAKGEPLGGYFYQYYEDLKRSMNPQLDGRVDLYFSGAFYSGFYVKVQDTEFLIGSTDPKENNLEAKYGEIFGLTDENQAKYVFDIFFEALRQYIENMTKIKME